MKQNLNLLKIGTILRERGQKTFKKNIAHNIFICACLCLRNAQ